MTRDLETHRHAAPASRDSGRPAAASFSLLRLSAFDRLLAAAAALALLWIGVQWALS